MKVSLRYLFPVLVLCSCAPKADSDEMIGTIAEGEPNQIEILSPSTDPNDPSQGEVEQSRGFYSNGSVVSSSALPLEGRGYIKIMRPRERWFGSTDLIYLITQSAKQMAAQFPNHRDSVQIGDMGARNGGFVSGHNSHQNGLDVDIAFIRKNETMQEVSDTSGFREKFVQSGKVTNNFDLVRNWTLAKLMVATGRPQRIFVNPVIKKAFCDLARRSGELISEAETLRRLRPYSGHEDHFHVRLTCPLNSPQCKAQEEIPAETGC